MNKVIKIAIVVSHPIQHFCPMYASWAKNPNIKLKVFFASNLGATSYVDKDFGRKIKWGNLYLDQFDHYFLNGNRTLEINSKLDAPDVEECLDNFRPQLLIHYGYIYPFTKRLRNWALKNKVKIGYISDSEKRHKEHIFKSLAKKIVLPNYFKKIDIFLSVGDANEAYYLSYGVPKSKILRMNFSIDINLYEHSSNNKQKLRMEFRKLYGIKDEDIVISVVGKLVEMKNQLDLVKLLICMESDFNNNFPKVHLLLAGSGPAENLIKEEAKKTLKNCVHFLGFVDPTDLPKVYAASDFYIQPSTRDAHSLAVSEAIFMGLPVIVTNTSGNYGLTDEVQINRNGFVYQLNNINDLFLCASKLINSELRKRFSECSIAISRKSQNRAHIEIIDLLLQKLV
jgi:glycosyltransferase involved in cell wall biosynthesis